MNNLREYREKLGINQAELSRKTGVLRTTINRLECGSLPLTLKMAQKFAPYFGCDAKDLIGGDNVRVIVITQDPNYKPTFDDVLVALLKYYGKDYWKATKSKPESISTFKDDKNKNLYRINTDLCDMTTTEIESAQKIMASVVSKKD